ncbi:MAG: hypothetical protein JXK94_10320 [Deltaproteobacteria bacterium]|nr:hypothetical protein [Deltaproteobacteria bacterium]
MKPVIILSGQTLALGVVRALGAMGVPVVLFHYDENAIAHVSKYVTCEAKVPHPERDEAGFIDSLLNRSEQFEGALLLPVNDETLVPVSRNKDLLQRHYRVACTDWDVTRSFIDKKQTYELAEAHGIPAPWTFVPRSEEEVISHASGVEFPCLVKPCQSHLFYDVFRQKMIPVKSVDEALEVYRQASRQNLEVMLQEIIPGDDAHVVNYNSYFSEGRPLVEFTAAHVRNAPPFFGSPRVAVSRSIPEVIEPGRKLLNCMGFYGFSCSEFKKDPRDGIFKLMEVNGRHNLSTSLAVRCGINFPWLHYRHLMFGEVPEAVDFQKEIYWIDGLRDLRYNILAYTHEKYSLRQYLRPYFKTHQFAIWDWQDSKPALQRIRYVASRIFRSLVSRLPLVKRRPAMPGSKDGQREKSISFSLRRLKIAKLMKMPPTDRCGEK